MAKLTIESDYGDIVVLIISPMDALKILKDYETKYPNTRTSQSLKYFIDRWVIDK